MSVEHRLREGFTRNAEMLDPWVEERLDAVLGRHRVRERVRWAASALAVAAAIGAVVVFGPRLLGDLVGTPDPAEPPNITVVALSGVFETTVDDDPTEHGLVDLHPWLAGQPRLEQWFKPALVHGVGEGQRVVGQLPRGGPVPGGTWRLAQQVDRVAVGPVAGVGVPARGLPGEVQLAIGELPGRPLRVEQGTETYAFVPSKGTEACYFGPYSEVIRAGRRGTGAPARGQPVVAGRGDRG